MFGYMIFLELLFWRKIYEAWYIAEHRSKPLFLSLGQDLVITTLHWTHASFLKSLRLDVGIGFCLVNFDLKDFFSASSAEFP